MRITVNGTGETIEGAVPLMDLVRAKVERAEPRGIAVSINGEIVSRGSWALRLVEDGDQIEILEASAGG